MKIGVAAAVLVITLDGHTVASVESAADNASANTFTLRNVSLLGTASSHGLEVR